LVVNPPSGSFFPIGTTTVYGIARDNCGFSNYCSFQVTVNPPVEPPIVVNCPTNNLTVTATGSNAVVYYTVSASGGCSPPPSLVVNPPSGSFFPIGTTTVYASARDNCGFSNYCSFQVTVQR
jgi:hypothetical protein